MGHTPWPPHRYVPPVPHGTGPPSCTGLQPHLGQDLLGQFSCPMVGGVALLILGNSVVHQPQGVGLCTTQSSACEDELLCQGHPQASRQPLSPSCQDGAGLVNNWEPREDQFGSQPRLLRGADSELGWKGRAQGKRGKQGSNLDRVGLSKRRMGAVGSYLLPGEALGWSRSAP